MNANGMPFFYFAFAFSAKIIIVIDEPLPKCHRSALKYSAYPDYITKIWNKD